MCGLLFGGIFRYDTERPEHPNNDRLIFSKGHASPLYYAMWAAAGKLSEDVATVIGAGVTLHEALKAYDALKKEGILIRVIDLYSIKPIDEKTLQQAAKETPCMITVEDHYPEGGIGEAVRSGLGTVSVPLFSLAVQK
jgi:transketolase